MLRLFSHVKFGVSPAQSKALSDHLAKLADVRRILMLKYADAENLRKLRSSNLKKIEEQSLFAFASDFAPIATEVHLLQSVNTTTGAGLDATLQGLSMTANAMRSSLQKYSLVSLIPEKGDSYDANTMSSTSPAELLRHPYVVDSVVSIGWSYREKQLTKAVVVIK